MSKRQEAVDIWGKYFIRNTKTEAVIKKSNLEETKEKLSDGKNKTKTSLLISSTDPQMTLLKQKQKDIKKNIHGTISTKKISSTYRSKISTGVFQDKIEEIFPGNTTKSGRKRGKTEDKKEWGTKSPKK